MAEKSVIRKIARHLASPDTPMKARYRALFTLKNLGGRDCIDAMAAAFADDSNLLKHEIAYCLGQMQDAYALDVLRNVIKDEAQHVIVRHEAAEALGAIGNPDDLELLEAYADSPLVELAETCQIAVERIRWSLSDESKEEVSENPYDSVDPAPPLPLSSDSSVAELLQQMMDEKSSLFARYRAMFSLRNMRTEESVLALTKGFEASSALFRHEIAYVLGQMAHPASEEALTRQLADTSENGMVRHECAEALGSVATDTCMQTLTGYVGDSERLVRESCEVALDMCEYEKSNEFQYANLLSTVS